MLNDINITNYKVYMINLSNKLRYVISQGYLTCCTWNNRCRDAGRVSKCDKLSLLSL